MCRKSTWNQCGKWASPKAIRNVEWWAVHSLIFCDNLFRFAAIERQTPTTGDIVKTLYSIYIYTVIHGIFASHVNRCMSFFIHRNQRKITFSTTTTTPTTTVENGYSWKVNLRGTHFSLNPDCKRRKYQKLILGSLYPCFGSMSHEELTEMYVQHVFDAQSVDPDLLQFIYAAWPTCNGQDGWNF